MLLLKAQCTKLNVILGSVKIISSHGFTYRYPVSMNSLSSLSSPSATPMLKVTNRNPKLTAATVLLLISDKNSITKSGTLFATPSHHFQRCTHLIRATILKLSSLSLRLTAIAPRPTSWWSSQGSRKWCWGYYFSGESYRSGSGRRWDRTISGQQQKKKQ